MGTIPYRTSPEMLRLAILAAIAVVAHSQLDGVGSGGMELHDFIGLILKGSLCMDAMNPYLCDIIVKPGLCDAYTNEMKYACAKSCGYCENQPRASRCSGRFCPDTTEPPTPEQQPDVAERMLPPFNFYGRR